MNPPNQKTPKEEEPSPKKAKLTRPRLPPLEQANDDDWPAAWIMPDGDVTDQKAPNQKDPNEPVSAAVLRELGVCYWTMDADAYDYPALAVPWDPKDAVDERLVRLRDDRGYSYADIITVHPDTLPEYEKKVASFFEEHIHDAEEIRYVLGGSGFFDIRDKQDRWVRIHVRKGDLITLPEGSYHRFTVDKDDIIHAMRLFIGQPVWTPFNRPCDDHPSRKFYVKNYVEEKKEDD